MFLQVIRNSLLFHMDKYQQGRRRIKCEETVKSSRSEGEKNEMEERRGSIEALVLLLPSFSLTLISLAQFPVLFLSMIERESSYLLPFWFASLPCLLAFLSPISSLSTCKEWADKQRMKTSLKRARRERHLPSTTDDKTSCLGSQEEGEKRREFFIVQITFTFILSSIFLFNSESHHRCDRFLPSLFEQTFLRCHLDFSCKKTHGTLFQISPSFPAMKARFRHRTFSNNFSC